MPKNCSSCLYWSLSRHSHTALLGELGWATLSKRCEYYKSCQMFKLVNNLVPTYLSETFPMGVVGHNYGLRNYNIRIPLSRTVSHKLSFYPSSVRLWNLLDVNIRESLTIHVFKYSLKQCIIPKTNHLYRHGMGKAPIQLARMRMGLSALNQHRHAYHYIPQNACVNCGIRPEDCKHFFL